MSGPKTPSDDGSAVRLMRGISCIDVIVPVYRGLLETRRCLQAVLSCGQQTSFELVVVDDCGPDATLRAWLAAFAAEAGFTLLVNEANLGFVASVNRAMRLHPERDVVLLNSDTEVANDWLDRLCRCAASDAAIGTVTPFSNNATICSYPRFCADNPMPTGIGVRELDAVFSRINAGAMVDIPTAVGFCMYIRRACLDRVGLFDEAAFGKGYGEENDFSRRAATAGWRNVLCADTFVFHVGAVSFSDTRAASQRQGGEALLRLHPDYDGLVRRFIARDPARGYREAVDAELTRVGSVPISGAPGRVGNRPVQLHITHDLGGGTLKWLRDYCGADRERVNLILKPWSHGFAFGAGLALYADAFAETPIRLWRFSAPIQATTVTHPEYRLALAEAIRDFGVDAVLVSSLIGHALDALDSGRATLVVAHDYYPFCPAINLYFGRVCQSCDAARLAECHEANREFDHFLVYPAEVRQAVRAGYVEAVLARRLPIACPSESVAMNLRRLDGRFHEVSFHVVPHGGADVLPVQPPHGPAPGGRLRVLVLGQLSPAKGMRLLLDAVDELTEFADLYLLGCGEVGELFRYRRGVHIVEQYALADLPGHVARIQPDVGLLTSICAETFSYTLSELQMLGIPPVATRLGSFADRIRDGETGYLYEPGRADLLACLRGIARDRSQLPAIRKRLVSAPIRSAREMVADYHRLLPLARAEDEPDWSRFKACDAVDGMLLAQAVELSSKWKEIKRLALVRDLRDIRLRDLADGVAGLHGRLMAQAGRLQELAAAAQARAEELRKRDEQLTALYASTSWAVSRPVRWLGAGVRKAGTLARCLAPVGRNPAALPGVLRDLVRAWHAGGMPRVKQSLLRLQEARTEPLAKAPPARPETAPVEPDWRQSVFQGYRASFTDARRAAIRARIEVMPTRPLISILVPTYDTPERMLREMLDSVRGQLYPNWELCLADDGSTSPRVRAVLEEYARCDARIKLALASDNRGVAHASNRALAMAGGGFAILLDHDDLLEEQALFRVAEAVLEDDPDMFYSDEVLVAEDGAEVQHYVFRPAFSPEYLRSHPYIVHLVGFRTDLLRRIGGWDESLGISQDYDLILRASERARTICHVPEMLYRWRIHGHSAGHRMMDRVMQTSREILRRHLERCGETGEVVDGPSFNFFETRYAPAGEPRVAIIIPTRNHGDMLRQCIEGLRATVGAIAHDIVVVDHESDEPATLAYLADLSATAKVLAYTGPFNFSAINNWAVAQLDGAYSHYLFCNNDVETMRSGWLERLLELGQRPDVGVVGAKLYYPDHKTIQHAGVVVACCGVAENLGRFRVTTSDPLDTGYLGSLIVNREVSAVTAACMLIKPAVFDEIGGFDVGLAVGYGDVDLCLRVRRQGYRVIFCGHAELVHHESHTRGRQDVDPHPADSARFAAKWRDYYVEGDPYFNPNLSLHSPDWQVSRTLEFSLDTRRRTYHAAAQARPDAG